MANNSAYIPALKYDWLTKFYDFLIQTFLQERAWKTFLIKRFSNTPNNVLDIGTGTATLPIMIKQHFPNAAVAGLDGDEKILELAQIKVKEQAVDIQLVKGMSFSLPFPDEHFDVVTSSLMLHHLADEDKMKTFREVLRVLKPRGEFNIADWGKPKDRVSRLLFYWVQFLDGFRTTNSNVKGLLPKFLSDSGFSSVAELKKFRTIGGTISIYKAIKLPK